MKTAQDNRFTVSVFAALALVMALTRFGHVGSHVSLPDASWAVFFVGGFYLARQWKWALPALMLGAVAIDFVAIDLMGVSEYCLTLAYWFVVPAYAALWLGGSWFSRHYALNAAGFGAFAASLLLSVSLCYLLTNGSFYWLGGRHGVPTIAGWAANFAAWYPRFVLVSCGYVAVAAVLHVLAAQFGRTLQGRLAIGGSR